jgi:hypothetical protein
MDLKYGDQVREMQGVIVEVSDGGVAIDFKGRLGHLRIPNRMIITDYPMKVGQEVGLYMTYPEVLSGKVNEKYVTNLEKRKEGNNNE